MKNKKKHRRGDFDATGQPHTLLENAKRFAELPSRLKIYDLEENSDDAPKVESVTPIGKTSNENVYLVEIRKHCPTKEDPYHYESFVISVKSSPGKAEHFIKENTDWQEKDSYWWFVVHRFNVDGRFPYDSEIVAYYDWSGCKLTDEPVGGIRDE